MKSIEVDDEVYGELERNVKGFEEPNDVLRRLLLRDGQVRTAVAGTGARTGRLYKLVDAGLVAPGDKLIHLQKRKGRRFEATVTAEGCIETTLGIEPAPSPALAALVGSQIDGWANWAHESSGKTLRDLREQLRRMTDVA